MTLNYPSGHKGSFEVKMDLASLLGLAVPGVPSSAQRVQPPYQEYSSGSSRTPVAGRRTIFQPRGDGFRILPPELRNRIYNLLFVKEEPVHLHAGYDFSRSGQFLSVQRQVRQEGASVLYGENQFIFSRSSYGLGCWFDDHVPETGYGHVRRCFDAIGDHNISLLKDVIFILSDAPKATTPYLDVDERRFVNDAQLRGCLKRLGKHGKLDTISIQFDGKRMVTRSDVDFLTALTSIMAKYVSLQGNLDWKIKREICGFMLFPGSEGPVMRAWNKP